MAGRLNRFLNLERPRKAAADAPPPVNKERFAPQEPEPGELERLRAERAELLDSGVELDTPHDDEQPFLRCPVCEADNARHAARCFNCATPLQTDAVHAWNREFWVRRRAEAPQAAAAAALPADAQRALGEALAREVAEREHARLAGWDDGTSRRPLGLRVLSGIGSKPLRAVVLVLLVSIVPGAIGAALFGDGATRFGSLLFVAAMLYLFVRPSSQ